MIMTTARWVALLALMMVGSYESFAATNRCNVDADHSIVGFSVPHMVISKTTGRFTAYTGFIDMDPDRKTVKAIEAIVKTASVNTNHQKRDTHLRSPDFFNVEKYPTMTYKMTSYDKQGDTYVAQGDLTLLGVTKPVVLSGTLNGIIPKDFAGNARAGFTGEGKLNRKDFGMNWNKALDNGGLVVGDDVAIRLEIECIMEK